MPDHDSPTPERFLERFGLSSFRTGQREVIATILAGKDSLCVMPTGGGKSLCYQLPALMLPGLTLVVSPLIALMKDQVDQLSSLKLPVTFINSTLSLNEQYSRLDGMASGEYRLVYVVPERFRSSRFIEAVRAADLSLLAVDEAHCISEWGHDFRPDYARLGYFRRMLGRPTTIALTATATDAVRRDIIEQLQLSDPRTFITGFARPNLFYEVRYPRSERDKVQILQDFLRETSGSGIIYTSSRKRTEEVAGVIHGQSGRSAVAYHAGLPVDQRRKAQEAFMSGKVQVIAATTAFGMGIDKADVRFVVHYNLPGTLEAYYQEAGRAGRDGKPSHCLLLFSMSDRFIQEYFINNAYPDREHVAAVYDFLSDVEVDPIEMTQQEIKERLGLPVGAEGVGACEQLLESAGVLERLIASENRAAIRLDSDLPTLVDLLPKQAKKRRRVMRAVEQLVGDRRQEVVYFRLADLARNIEMQPAAITPVLRELNQLDVFTYVPPFRGRAIRMIQSEKSFDELEIDFETHDRLKAMEHEKLDRVIRFAQSRKCRQQTILDYFGDPSDEPCGHCDNCRTRGSMASEPLVEQVNENVLTTVRIVLSGVARIQTRFSCGKNLIAQMLCGSGSAKIKKLGFDKLSTFGLLQHLTQPEAVSLIDGLVTTGHLNQHEITPRRPVVEMTEEGTAVMMGTTKLDVVPPMPVNLLPKLCQIRPNGPVHSDPEPHPPKATTKSVPSVDAPESPLHSHVTENPQVTYHSDLSPNDELSYSSEPFQSPETSQYSESLQCSDIPQHTEVTQHSKPGKNADSPQLPTALEDQPGADLQPSYYWTWRLFMAGFSIEECQATRGMKRAEVVDHLIRANEEGRVIRATWCLSEELLTTLNTVVGEGRPGPIREILPKLPLGTTYEEVQFFLVSREHE